MVVTVQPPLPSSSSIFIFLLTVSDTYTTPWLLGSTAMPCGSLNLADGPSPESGGVSPNGVPVQSNARQCNSSHHQGRP